MCRTCYVYIPLDFMDKIDKVSVRPCALCVLSVLLCVLCARACVHARALWHVISVFVVMCCFSLSRLIVLVVSQPMSQKEWDEGKFIQDRNKKCATCSRTRGVLTCRV